MKKFKRNHSFGMPASFGKQGDDFSKIKPLKLLPNPPLPDISIPPLPLLNDNKVE
ncbi:MAG: hypothetical protein AAF208_11995 [Cyanobacteria bacterium P01_A01_bin.45]